VEVEGEEVLVEGAEDEAEGEGVHLVVGLQWVDLDLVRVI
jgi:hypothetical protein